jgi:serine/threonine protein kinase
VPVKLTVNRFSSFPPRLGEGITIANRFRLMRQIGEGGMGSVWLATHLGLGIPCAIKFVEGEWRRQPEMVARFEREAKVEAQLRSPHVVHVLDHGVWNGTPYIAMEFLEGEALASRLDREGPIDAATTHRVIAHVARALTRAHAIGIVHRDLKPENIYLVPGDDGEIAKVLDFGVAKWTSDWVVSSVTKTGLLVGTPLYMSPEQARGTKEIDFRADLWSLAVIAFQCLTGELPFLSEGLGDLLAKIMFEPIPVPSAIVPSLTPEFDAWWARASSRDMASRFQSAKELADSLAVALGVAGPSMVAAAPPGFREASLSDYTLSVSDGAIPQESQPPPAMLWPPTHTGKLLAAGVVGVIVIASSIWLQSGRDGKKAGQTLVTPSVAPVSQTASPEPPPPVPVAPAPKTENTAEAVRSPSSEPTTAATAPSVTATATPVESLQKSNDRKDDTSRRDRASKDTVQRAPSRPDKQNKPSPPPPPKAKGTDFGI